MSLILFVVVLFAAIFFLVFTFGVESKEDTVNKECQVMIQRFEPDNLAPELTAMIDFHKENEKNAVRYEV